MNLNKTEALEIITAANPQFFASVDDPVLEITTHSLLSAALALINAHKPLIKRGGLILQGGETEYAAPGDIFEIIGSDYGIEHLKNFTPLSPNYQKGIPSLNLDNGQNGLIIRLSNPVPGTTQQFVGTMVGYDYKANYKIDGDNTGDSNVPHTLQIIIEAASQVEVLRRRIMSQAFKTVGDGHKNKSAISPELAYDKSLKAFKNYLPA